MTETPMRKDVARNRSRLIEAAHKLMRIEGLGITLKDVAQEAGVGVGTVYRHFPTKEDLVEALYVDQLEEEVYRARVAAESSHGWSALVEYLKESMRLQAENRGFRALMCPEGSVFSTVQQCKSEIDPYLEALIDLAQQQGDLRSDCTVRDIALLQVALVGIMDATGGDAMAYLRHLDYFLAGVRVCRDS